MGYSCFPHNLHSTPSKPRTLRLQIHSSPAPSKQGSLQHPGPGGNPHDSRGQKEPCLRELDEGLSGTGRAFWAYSPVQSGTAQNTRPSLGQVLNEPYYSLMRLLSVRLSGEGVERENALGYQANLSSGTKYQHAGCACVLCLCPGGCPSAATYIRRVPTGERVMDLFPQLPRSWDLPQHRGPCALLPEFWGKYPQVPGGEISEEFPLSLVSIQDKQTWKTEITLQIIFLIRKAPTRNGWPPRGLQTRLFSQGNIRRL